MPEETKPNRILVIDDEEHIREMLSDALTFQDYEVLTAENGSIGLEKFRKETNVGVVLTDLLMPEMNGMQFLEEAKKLDPYVEVILLTGFGSNQTVIDSLKKGAFDYLQKPTNIDELFLTVKRAFERRNLYEENRTYQENLERLVQERTQELTETKNFLQSVLDSSEDYSIMATDLDGIITLFNRGSEKLLGYESTEVINKETVLLFTPTGERGEGPLRKIQRADGRITYEREKIVWRKDGEPKTINLSVTELRNDMGELVGNLGIAKDITEEKKLQMELKQYMENLEELVDKRTEELAKRNEELEKTLHELNDTQQQLVQSEKLASLGQLAAGVAHEINNPVGFVHSNLSSLKKYLSRIQAVLEFCSENAPEHCDSTFSEDYRKSWKKNKLDTILPDIGNIISESIEGTMRVKTIVQDLKNFSNLDRSNIKDTDLQQAIKSTLNIAWNEIKYKADVHEEYDEIPLVRCNIQQINQVILNLLVNAAQAIDEGAKGAITIRTKQHDEHHVRIEIEDTGSGIPEETLNHIFDPFFTTKEVGSGTGLGLSISYRIVKEHGGEILVDTEVGKGTKFSIILPIEGVPENTDEG